LKDRRWWISDIATGGATTIGISIILELLLQKELVNCGSKIRRSLCALVEGVLARLNVLDKLVRVLLPFRFKRSDELLL
jgi:hypothetical protein